MKKLLTKINAQELIPFFENRNVKYYVKRFGTTIIIDIDKTFNNCCFELSLFIDKLDTFLKCTKYRSFELFINIENEEEKKLIAKKLIEKNFPQYICVIKKDKLCVDLKYSKTSNYDLNYIKELVKNLKIESTIENIEFENVKSENENINLEFLNCSNAKKTQNNNAYIREFDSQKAQKLGLAYLPKTLEELNNLMNPKINTDGEIFDLEIKQTKKSTLYTYKITNYIESAILKCFSKEPLNYKVGDTVDVTGVLTFDDFSKQIVINIANSCLIRKIDVEYKKEMTLENLFETEEQMRCELHVHSNFSTQDGLCSVKEYFENAKSFGLEALSIVDHENVQSFPEIEKWAKTFNIKPIYGVELNVIDKNSYKIFYKQKSTKNHIVGIDIETTGFSNVYDEIIEISAYKAINGTKQEYSRLIKLDDYNKLTPKITELTSITKEMLINEGVDIKSALEGLINFIDDGIIVAHNATFDVYFLEEKIRKILKIEKRYSFIDTLNFSRSVLNDGKMKKFALDKVCNKLKIELTEHHRAIYDAKVCLEIYEKLLLKIENQSIEFQDIKKNDLILISLKISSKKQKEKLLDFFENNSISFKEYNNIEESSNRTNALFNFSVNYVQSKTLQTFLKENITIKIKYMNKKIENYSDNFSLLNNLIKESEILANARPFHVTALVKNQVGLKELYKLISLSNTERITPRGNCVFLNDIEKESLRSNILLGSSCANGVFKNIYEKGFNHVNINIYDYIEIQPFNTYLSTSESYNAEVHIKDCINRLIFKCKEEGKTIVADTDAHYIYPNLQQYRNVYINTFGVGGVMHPLYGSKNPGLHVLYSTNKLIETLKNDYNWDIRFIRKIVLENTKKINDEIDNNIHIVPDKLYIPNDDFLSDKVLDIVGYKVPSIKKEFEKIVNEEIDKRYRLFNKERSLPIYIKERLEKEMKSIIGHGFYIIYYIAYLLVKKSNNDGYVVGSRGSVGSSFVANLLGITEVNSLAPHYRCPKCHFQIYKGVKNIFKGVSDEYINEVEKVDDGFDLPRKKCPICGKEDLERDGHDIPFETFLGFNGDKTPDIDLNFSGDYQSQAHNFCKEVFGENHAFRAGTIATVASKTAESYLKKYYQKIDLKNISQAEISRRSFYLTNVKRTTGQHPGGIIVLPSDMDIYDFTPIQYPANKKQDWYTTHLDYNAIHENVLKMDILGHDDPTILKFLMDLVKENPNEYPFNSPKEIPIDDPQIMTFLKANCKGIINSLGIPEFGTSFVKGMLSDIKPNTFYDLVKVSGLSHGTDVWNTNAQELVNGDTSFGTIPFRDVIGCRDDIMVQLIYKGLDSKQAFNIMEFVRKGKVLKEPDKWEEYKKIMISCGVPEWYIWSCEKIKYMFPKAHAVAYVLSAMRIAWFKANKPLDFYQAFFTVRASVFDCATISTNDVEYIQNKIDIIKSNKESTDVEIDSIPYLEIAKEMIEAGYVFEQPHVNKSHGSKFLKTENNNGLLIPFSALNGVGEVTATNVYLNRGSNYYTSIEDLKKRGKADKKFIDALQSLGITTF